MALIVTPGAIDADSYASLAYALTYHAARGHAAWAIGLDADRETALRRATVWLDSTYRAQWENIGYRINARVQALDWPMSNIRDVAGWYVDYATIPTEVVNATCEAALREYAIPGSLLPDYVQAQAVETATAGPVSVTFKAGIGAGTVIPILTVVDGIMGRLFGGISRNSVRMVRG